jgi:ABC-type branched-subunit amino acid transport system substrate-binding protein
MASDLSNTSEPWRVGVLFSRTGYMALIEETQLRGTLVAIEEINAAGGVNGRELVPLLYDPASENSMFRTYAKRMLTCDGVQTIFGCYTSSSRKAVLPIVERLNGLLWYPTLYEGFEYSPNVVYTGAAPNQNSMALCDFLVENYGSRFFFIGSDYIYPRESNRIMRELLGRRGGEVVGEQYVSMRAHRHDFLPIMQMIKRAQPDAIFSTVVGSGTVYLYQSYTDFGFDPKSMPIASLTTTEAEIRAMGYDVGSGHVTAAPYFQSVDAPSNRRFVALYKKRFGDDEPTNMCVEAAYFQVHMFARALEKTNSLDTDRLRNMVLGSTFEAPQGQVTLDPTCSHASLWSRIGLARRDGQFEVVRESASAVPADPFLQCAVAAIR